MCRTNFSPKSDVLEISLSTTWLEQIGNLMRLQLQCGGSGPISCDHVNATMFQIGATCQCRTIYLHYRLPAYLQRADRAWSCRRYQSTVCRTCKKNPWCAWQAHVELLDILLLLAVLPCFTTSMSYENTTSHGHYSKMQGPTGNTARKSHRKST